MKPLYIVGGNGYIGQRVALAEDAKGREVTIVDPCYLGEVSQVIRDAGIEVWKNAAHEVDFPKDCHVLYLASFHEPPAHLKPSMLDPWRTAMREVMVQSPLRIAAQVNSFIYLSSMRVLTHYETSLYAQMKHVAESLLFEYSRSTITILRPGTVYGDYNPELYNRTITVPNNWILRGDLPDDKWRAFICPMEHVLGGIALTLLTGSRGTVFNLTCGDTPYTNFDLASHIPRQPSPGEVPRETHPTMLMAKAYGLPLPKGTS